MKKLLFLCAMLLIGGSANAAFDANGERMKPVPTKAAFNYGDTLYMYNVGAKMFWGGGNDWGTRSSVLEDGAQVTFTKHIDAATGEWDGKTVKIRNWVVKHNRWDNVFIDNADGTMWVDNSSRADSLWNVVAKGGEIYRFQSSELNPAFPGDGTTFIGHDGVRDNGTNTRTWAFLAEAEGMNIDWYFVAATDYKAYQDVLLPAYEASKSLWKALNNAKVRGIDVAEQQGVYANEAATVEELNAATAAVNKAIENFVSVEFPADKTSAIVNPSFNSGTSGWSGTGTSLTVRYAAAEHYNTTFDTYQDVSGLPAGVYMVTVQAYYRSGWAGDAYNNYVDKTNNHASVYVTAGTYNYNVAILNPFDGAKTERLNVGSESQSNGYFIPNDMSAAAAYFNAGRYVNKVMFYVEDGNVRIGVKKSETLAGDWTMFDNWTLTFYGDKDDAYKLLLQDIISGAPSYPAETVATKSVLDEYNAFVASIANLETKEEILAAKGNIAKAAAVVEANIAAWKELVAVKDEAAKVSTSAELDDTEEKKALAEYLEKDLVSIITALELTTEQVNAEVGKVKEMISNTINNSMKVGADVTSLFLVNPDYSEGYGNNVPGWSGNWTNVASGCMEAYALTWDAYQNVENAPVGVYEVSLQGFYRVKRDNAAWEMWQNGQQTCPGHVYVNNYLTEVPCIFSDSIPAEENIYSGDYMTFTTGDGATVHFPNDMTTAGQAFANGMYKASAFGLVAKEGDGLRLGVKGKQQSDTWVIWDNFKLVYQGFKADIIKPHLQQAIDSAKVQKGMVISNRVRAMLDAEINNATAVVEGEDGKAMFDALSAFFSLNDTVTACLEAYQRISEGAEELDSVRSWSTADSTVIKAAIDLYLDINESLTAGTCDDRKADAILDRIASMIVALNIPAGEATEESPLDYTAYIKNPNYEKNGLNSIEGWDNTDGYSFGNSDYQRFSLMIEFYEQKFDIYQDLVDIPNGIYEVGVQAFCSFGNTEDDYKKYQADSLLNEAWLYATPDGDEALTATSYLKHRTSEAGEDKGYYGTTSFVNKDDSIVYVPNDMVSTKNYFNDSLYINKVRVKVKDGKLRIGVAKPEQIGGDWVVMDSWTLKYLGEDSADVAAKQEAIMFSWERGKTYGGAIAGNGKDSASVNYQHYENKVVRISSKKNNIDADNVTITLDKALKAGDKIAITAYRYKNTDANGNLYLQFENGAVIDEGTEVVWNNMEPSIGEKPNTKVYKLGKEFEGSKVIRIARSKASTNVYIKKIEIIKPIVAYLCGSTAAPDEAIYNALKAADYNAIPLNYDDSTLTVDAVNRDFVDKYDLVVFAGSTGSSKAIASSFDKLLGKTNLLSTKAFWYDKLNPKGTKGTNPGGKGNPSLALTKTIANHPIFKGIAGDTVVVFNDMSKSSGRYLQGNGAFADDALGQTVLGKANGTKCIGETWVDNYGYVIIPVDGAQPEGYLTETGKQLYVNAAKYLIGNDRYELTHAFATCDTTMRAGLTVKLPVSMKNESEIFAIQCDIHLPEGITLQSVDEKYDVAVDSARQNGHTVTATAQKDGSIRLVVAAKTPAAINGNDGIVFYPNIKIGVETEGEQSVVIKNILVTEEDRVTHSIADVTAKLNVTPIPVGDVNNDNQNAIDDVVLTINYILGEIADSFIPLVADINKDSQVLIDDVVLMINKVLGITPQNLVAARNTVEFETLTVGGKATSNGADLAMSLSNASGYVAMQFDMNIPSDVSINDIKVTSASNHQVTFREVSEGVVRVIVTSFTNETFDGVSQLAVSVNSLNSENINITNAFASTSRGELVKIADTAATLGEITGISNVGVMSAPTDIYDLNGRLVKKNAISTKGLSKGVYMMNGQKVIIK